MTRHEVRSEYERRSSTLQKDFSETRTHQIAAAIALGIAVALLLALGFGSIGKSVPLWWTVFPFFGAAGAAKLYAHCSRMAYRHYRLHLFYERALQRLDGNWSRRDVAAEQFADSSHTYALDLSIFGDGSLFEFLCIARSGIGRQGLAMYLLQAPHLEEVLARQEAIRELRSRTDIRERVSLLGRFDASESRWETFSSWLESPLIPFRPAWRIVLLGTSILLASTLAAGLIGLCAWMATLPWICSILLFHSAAGLYFRARVNRMKASIYVLSTEIQVLRQGLHVLENEPFRSAKLKRLSAEVSAGAASVRRLELLLNAVYETNKDWFYQPSLALMLGTQLCIAIEDWRTRHREALRAWLEAWAEFEALSSLAGYAYENPDHVFPEFIKGEARFEARALGHPLLPAETCVRNDVTLSGGARFYIVSGSNMSGKSTLLRAIGTNAILALAGAPVRAASLRLSHLSVCASIAVVDSLLSGRSKFLAEVDRLRKTIEASERGLGVGP